MIKDVIAPETLAYSGDSWSNSQWNQAPDQESGTHVTQKVYSLWSTLCQKYI